MIPIDRRRFLAAGAALSAMPVVSPVPALSGPRPTATLRIVKRVLEIDGKPATVFGLTGADGRPGLSLPAGERAIVRLVNEAEEPTVIHWHGLAPSWQQDGGAAHPLRLIGSGTTHDFDLRPTDAGTNWLHAYTCSSKCCWPRR